LYLLLFFFFSFFDTSKEISLLRKKICISWRIHSEQVGGHDPTVPRKK
jgi:hypothetical protein